MTAIYKSIYRKFLPKSVRTSPLFNKLKVKLFNHDQIYNADYYKSTVEVTSANSADKISESILYTFKVKNIIDVGCGTGAILSALKKRGAVVAGLEYSEAALKYCRERDLDVEKFNLEKDILERKEKYDLAISLEVAEHLPESIADRYIDLLTSLSNLIVFTAAQPGQGGTDHINEQYPPYWISKFQKKHFIYNQQLADVMREEWKASNKVAKWYYQNLMIFRKEA